MYVACGAVQVLCLCFFCFVIFQLPVGLILASYWGLTIGVGGFQFRTLFFRFVWRFPKIKNPVGWTREVMQAFGDEANGMGGASVFF